jgi:hypothetical protein
MKRLLSFALPFVLAIAWGAWAQSDTTPSPSSTNQATSPTASSSTQSNSQNSTSTQANPATSSTMAQSGTAATNQPSLEGCVVVHQTDYFLQPDRGQPLKLSSSEDLSQHVGHRVRVQGSVNSAAIRSGASGTSSSAKNSTGNAGSAGQSQSEANTQYQEITLTKVETISESCPSALEDQSVPKNNSQSPK